MPTTKADFDKIKTALIRGNLSGILKRLGATNEQITDRGLALPSEKPPSGPKKSPGSGDSTGGSGTAINDVTAAKATLDGIISSKRPAGPPPPPPLNISTWAILTNDEIETVIANQNGITKPINGALKALVERQKAEFSAKGADGLAVLTALGITP